ncbi:G-type lectin S-receptor-like serine/threonine-protein kinase SD2-2 [Typha latifolia]|uniref:G-type lectin S-receptor-like serine/threonine-protein kinase SD2-2 n=1 Tax=Typha latifolia TaxID=4733 RepID=UPI003C3083D6
MASILLPLLLLLSATSTSCLLITPNSSLLSPNRTFALGFFSPNHNNNNASHTHWYLSIYYASLPIRTLVWVANRDSPLLSSSPTASISKSGRLAAGDPPVWLSGNTLPASSAILLDSGNLLLLSPSGDVVWESFRSPSDTWLPGMAVDRRRPIVSWRSPFDPSPGPFSLRLLPGEFELAFEGKVAYWSSGKWTGDRFAGVPEMTVPYIYEFRFEDPFGPGASFSYSVAPELAEEAGIESPALSRIVVESSGQLMQYTWSPQAASWRAYWSRPESGCGVYGRCGRLGICAPEADRTCHCPRGFQPTDPSAWSSGDFSGGCSTGDEDDQCSDDRFEEIGTMDLDIAADGTVLGASRGSCEEICRRNCSCFGLIYDSGTRLCRNLYGDAYNLRNGMDLQILLLRVPAIGVAEKPKHKWKKKAIVIGAISGFLAILSLASILAFISRRRIQTRRELKKSEEDAAAFSNVMVFSYKELCAATQGFSDKLGHGSFGAVFRGELADSTPVAVKRPERAGGDREFLAEVRTIGSVHHVNLVRLRGFCCEGQHRLLVYDLMPLGSLSAHLGSGAEPPLPWSVRLRIAIGTARAVAYLHEGCRDCIIHCDIKPENILLDKDFTPKVSDFGMAKLIGREISRVVTTMRGTWGYVAPEWISGTAITPKADVYSYGMTLLEILAGKRNAETAAAEKDTWVCFPAWAAQKIIEGDVAAVVDSSMEETGGYDPEEATRVGRVAVWCIQEEEAARPAMGTVVKMLEGTVAAAPPPPPRLLQALMASGESFPRAGIVSGGDESDSAGSGRIVEAKSEG